MEKVANKIAERVKRLQNVYNINFAGKAVHNVAKN
jgi:hypothetical protein